MDKEKTLEAVQVLRELVLGKCERRLGKIPAAKRMDLGILEAPDQVYLGHALYMCDAMEEFIASDQLGKAMLWLGFAQGVLCARFGFSIESMRQVNMPFPDRLSEENGTG